MAQEYNKILIIRIGAIGDVVNSTIIQQAIKQEYPDCEIQFLTSDFISGILESDPDLSKVWSFDLTQKDNIFYLLKMAWALRKEKFDLVINLQKSLRNVFMLYFAGIKKQIFRNKEAGHSADVFFKSLYGTFDNLQKPESLSLYISDKSKEKVANCLEGLQRPFFVINPGGESDSSRQGRIWPLENWKNLSEKLLEKYGGTIFVVGSKAEKKYQESLSEINSVKMFTGELSLEENVALINEADFFVSGDSGPLHIAGALGLNLLGLYGSTPPESCGPYNNSNIIVADYECVACCQRECALNADKPDEIYSPCMKAISVEDVLSKINL